jgi:hypothetical protein
MSVLRDHIQAELLYLDRYKPPHQRLGLEGEVWVLWRLLCDGRLDELKEEAHIYRTKLEEGMMTAQQFEVRHVEGLQPKVHGTL